MTTSTCEWSAASRSISRPLRSKRLRSGSKSTRKSMPLRSSSSPRATEPNTRMFRAPRLAAIRRISSRFVVRMFLQRHRISILPRNESLRTANRSRARLTFSGVHSSRKSAGDGGKRFHADFLIQSSCNRATEAAIHT